MKNTKKSKRVSGKTAPRCSLSSDDVKIISDALWDARSDIWQTARVSEYNLTGKDPVFPDDKPLPVPKKPLLVTRKGLDESYAVIKRIEAASCLLHSKANNGAEIRRGAP